MEENFLLELVYGKPDSTTSQANLDKPVNTGSDFLYVHCHIEKRNNPFCKSPSPGPPTHILWEGIYSASSCTLRDANDWLEKTVLFPEYSLNEWLCNGNSKSLVNIAFWALLLNFMTCPQEAKKGHSTRVLSPNYESEAQLVHFNNVLPTSLTQRLDQG